MLVKKTNILDKNYNLDEISKSYKWEVGRTTFPPNWWTEIIIEYLYDGITAMELEDKYIKDWKKASNMSSKIKKTTKGMYINTLLRRFMIQPCSEGCLKEEDYNSVRRKVIDYMQSIIKDVKKKYRLSETMKKNIQHWEESIESNGEGKIFDTSNTQTSVEIDNKINDYIINTVNKIKSINYKFDTNNTKTNFTFDEEKNEKTGSIGEDIVYKYLVSEYGLDNVYHASKINKYSHYDISVKHKDGSIEYIEVKSSTRPNSINWYISRRELEFYNQNKESYSIIFVKNIFISDDPENLAIVEKIKNPIISIRQDKIGFENGELIISPIKYIGLA